jgi:hypothetical protein
MSRTGVWAAIGAGLAVILFGLAAWLFMSGKGTSPWNQPGDMAKFVEECFVDLGRRGALDAGNTAAQLRSACSCFADEFYPLIEGKTREEATAFTKQPESLERVQAIRKKCGYQVGLDGIEEWWN